MSQAHMSARSMFRWDGSWFTYTPSWTAVTTNPTMGNGSIIGRYCRTGNTALVQIKIVVGSTTSIGSGNYRLSYPPGLAPAGDTLTAPGSFVGLDDSAVIVYHGSCWNLTATEISAYIGESGARSWSHNAPFTVANNDIFNLSIAYPV